MISHRRWRTGATVIGVGVLVAVHGIVLHLVTSSVVLPVAIVSGAIALLLLEHLGMVGMLRGALHRRSRDRAKPR